MTTTLDGWCRASDCPGYVRPRADHDEEHAKRAPRGTRRHVAETGSIEVPLNIDEVDGVRISQTARDSFRFHHRGSDNSAESQLRTMLEDFLLRSARQVRERYVTLARGGYELILDRGMGVVTGYRTVHRERTWEQVKAGVPSRYGKGKAGRAAREPAPEPGTPLPAGDVATAVNTATVHLSSRARSSFARLHGMRQAEDDALDAAMLGSLAAVVTSATVGARTDERLVELLAGDLVWLVTRDARVVVGVKRRTAAERGA